MTEAAAQPLIPAGCIRGPDGRHFMTDAKGRLVPLSLVKDQDQLEDQMVRRLIDRAADLSAQIDCFKGHTFDDVGAFLDVMAERYGAKPKGRKGNMSFSTVDGCMMVKVAVADTMSFGPELQVAKVLIDACIAEWSEGSRVEIRAIVEHAFRTDKQGEVSREAVFSLRRIAIDDERWCNAMRAINDSIRVMGSKTYLRFYRRATPTDAWQAVTIDLASAADVRAPADVAADP